MAVTLGIHKEFIHIPLSLWKVLFNIEVQPLKAARGWWRSCSGTVLHVILLKCYCKAHNSSVLHRVTRAHPALLPTSSVSPSAVAQCIRHAAWSLLHTTTKGFYLLDTFQPFHCTSPPEESSWAKSNWQQSRAYVTWPFDSFTRPKHNWQVDEKIINPAEE